MAAKLGDLLVQAGVLTRDQIEEALERQRSTPDRPKLGEVILQMGLTTEESILEVLSQALHLPSLDLDSSPPTAEATRHVPLVDAQNHSIVPVRLETAGHRRRLVLAMSDPTNVQVIDDLQFRTGMVVRPVITTASQVRRAIRQAYRLDPELTPSSDDLEPVRSFDETWVGDAPAPKVRVEVAELRVVAGPVKGKRYLVPMAGSIDFGRGDTVEASIPDRKMSRRHFLVVDTGDALELVDLGSSNGTLVNQEATRRAVLKSGDFIEAGDTIMQVSLLARR